MSKVKSTKVYLKLFEKLALYHPEVEALVIWWSELSDLFFDNLRHLRTLIRVYFVSCEMGDGLSSQLSRL